MFVSEMLVTRGAKILWEGSIQEASFGILYEGVEGDWDEAQRRAAGIGDQLVNDWTAEMSQRGRIECISPTIISLFDRSEEEEAVLRHVLKQEAPKRVVAPIEGSLMSKAVKLVFDATGSQDRMNRILRAYEEPYTFIRQDNGNWTCLNREGRAYQLYIDLERSLGHCTCQDFQQRGIALKMPCKHLYGYVVQTQKTGWKSPEEKQKDWDIEAACGEAFRKKTDDFLKKNTDLENGHHYTKKGFFTGGVKENKKGGT